MVKSVVDDALQRNVNPLCGSPRTLLAPTSVLEDMPVFSTREELQDLLDQVKHAIPQHNFFSILTVVCAGPALHTTPRCVAP